MVVSSPITHDSPLKEPTSSRSSDERSTGSRSGIVGIEIDQANDHGSQIGLIEKQEINQAAVPQQGDVCNNAHAFDVTTVAAQFDVVLG